VIDAFAPAKLGPVTLRNRIIKAATFEGRTPDALVTDELIAFHRELAAGGVGMTTVAYLAVAPEGRTDRHQIYWRPEALAGLRRLTDAVHAQGAAISAQIGHAGPVANPRSNGVQAIAPSRMFHPLGMQWCQVPGEETIERITQAHADAALMATECGFDAVEVHVGHNYLLSAFLSPKLNRRKDSYGGSLENRARFARAALLAVREAVGDRIAIIAKVNMDDGVGPGLHIDESIQVVRWLEADGSVDAVEMTVGSSLLNPMYLFRGDAPRKEFAAAMPQPVKFGLKIVGKGFLREYPYRDGYLLDKSKQVRATTSLAMVLLGGVTNRAVIDEAMTAGFEFVAMGRALLREPDLVNQMRVAPGKKSLCSHCNRCMPTIYTGTRCVEVPGSSGGFS
jgi:2,4-dienoyl-CoA reductase-like NADH-dependent reductase (Old Yellow Enzyme family)